MNHLHQFLIGKTPEEVIVELKKLKVSVLTQNDLYLFNYDDDAPRGNPIVEGCRGVVFQYKTHNNDDDNECGTWICVRSSFDRFYNHGEDHSPPLPPFNEITIQEKKDGTLLMVSVHDNKICAGTRNLFDVGKMIGLLGKNMEYIAKRLLEPYVPTLMKNADKTFMFELCTPWNPVVVNHDEPHISLLGIRSNVSPYSEFDVAKIDFEGFRPTTPPLFNLHTIQDCQDEVARLGGANFEGFILKFGPTDAPNRIKLKSATFLNLMRTGQSRVAPEELLICAMIDDDVEEVLAVHPTWKESIYPQIKCLVDTFNQSFETAHKNTTKLPKTASRKDIATAAGKSPFMLFHIDNFGSEETFEVLWKKFKRDNKTKIVKHLLSNL